MENPINAEALNIDDLENIAFLLRIAMIEGNAENKPEYDNILQKVEQHIAKEEYEIFAKLENDPEGFAEYLTVCKKHRNATKKILDKYKEKVLLKESILKNLKK